MPDGAAETFAGVVDLVESSYLSFDEATLGKEVAKGPIPERLSAESATRRAALIERLAELHEPLTDLFLAEKPIGVDDLRAALRAVTVAGKAVPVLCGAALRNIGIQPLLDAACWYLPSPTDLGGAVGTDPRDGSKVVREPDDSAPFSALVFKIQANAAADLFFMRVYSGRLDAGERAWNPRTGERERLRRMVRMHADRGEAVTVAEAGDIIAVTGLHRTVSGDTLCDEGKPVLLEPIRFPSTVVSIAIEPRTSADRDRLSELIPRLQREDPPCAPRSTTRPDNRCSRGWESCTSTSRSSASSGNSAYGSDSGSLVCPIERPCAARPWAAPATSARWRASRCSPACAFASRRFRIRARAPRCATAWRRGRSRPDTFRRCARASKTPPRAAGSTAIP
jgi:translation elongation factor EF-G